MNLDKKRKRQSGRQKRKEPTYKIYIDEWAKVHAIIDKQNKGRLPGLPAASIVIPEPVM